MIRFGATVGRVRVSADLEETLQDLAFVEWLKIVPELEATAKKLVPVDTGALKASIKAHAQRRGRGTVEARVVASMPYADFVEYGTGRAGAGTVDAGPGGQLDPPGSYRHGPSAGMVAQPYLRPAV